MLGKHFSIVSNCGLNSISFRYYKNKFKNILNNEMRFQILAQKHSANEQKYYSM